MIDPETIETARRALGRLLAAHRKAAGYTQVMLADEVGYSRSTIANVETGRQHVTLDFWRRCEAALGTSGDLVAATDEIEEMIHRRRPQVAALAQAERDAKIRELRAARDGRQTWVMRGHNLGDSSLFRPAEEDDVNRRTLLALLAGFGTNALAPSEQLLRRFLDLVLTSAPRDIENWRLACGDHLHAIRTRPPYQVRDDLLLDLLTVRRQIETPCAENVTELHRVMAALSTLHANVLTRLGEHGSALRWCRTARNAADDSGDLELRLLVRASEAGFGLYGQRDPATVLHLTLQAQQLAGDRPSLGLALITGTQAKALSLLGKHEEAKQRLRMFVDAAPEDAPSNLIPAYWTGDQVHFAESWVHAAAGDEAEADEARDRVLAYTFLDYQYAANVELHEALCTVVKGGVDEGARQAATVIDSLQSSHSEMIIETGRTVLRAIQPKEQQRTAVKEFRETLTGATREMRALTAGAHTDR